MPAHGIFCPLCGKSVWYDGERTEIYCTYCGTKLFLEDKTVCYEESPSREVRRAQKQLAARTEQDIRKKRTLWRTFPPAFVLMCGVISALLPRAWHHSFFYYPGWLLFLFIPTFFLGQLYPANTAKPPRPADESDKLYFTMIICILSLVSIFPGAKLSEC